MFKVLNRYEVENLDVSSSPIRDPRTPYNACISSKSSIIFLYRNFSTYVLRLTNITKNWYSSETGIPDGYFIGEFKW